MFAHSLFLCFYNVAILLLKTLQHKEAWFQKAQKLFFSFDAFQFWSWLWPNAFCFFIRPSKQYEFCKSVFTSVFTVFNTVEEAVL